MSRCEVVSSCSEQMVRGPDLKGTVPENLTQELVLNANTMYSAV